MAGACFTSDYCVPKLGCERGSGDVGGGPKQGVLQFVGTRVAILCPHSHRVCGSRYGRCGQSGVSGLCDQDCRGVHGAYQDDGTSREEG